MIVKGLADLQEVFVPFEASRAKEGVVIFHNKYIGSGLTRSEVVSRYSYVVTTHDAGEAIESDKKTFFAERYGGDGILTNGGGGRCGFDGDYQVKGIGPNKLVGEDVEVSHADGFLSVQSALYEAIWAEVINIALPYGAVRTLAVIDAGTKIPQSGQIHPRGLLVRVPVVRPAHFIRAVYFKEKKINSMSEDAKRVCAAIKKLVDFLPSPAVSLQQSGVSGRLGSGMLELAKRYAEQFAAARAKCLVHENVSASNLSMDGAWLDLSSAGIISDLTIGDKTDIDNFKKEYFPAVNCIKSICFYLEKYGVISLSESNILLSEVSAIFAKEYERQLKLYSVLRAGFPKCFLIEVVSKSEFIEFSKYLEIILCFKGFSTTPIVFDSGWQGYESWQFRLYDDLLGGKILNEEADLSWLGVGRVLASELCKSYNVLFDLVCDKAAAKGISFASVIFGISINSTRLNRTSKVLYELGGVISNYAANTSHNNTAFSFESLVEDVYHAAYLGFFNESEYQVPVWSTKIFNISYDIPSEKFKIKTQGNVFFTENITQQETLAREDINHIVEFYKGVRGGLFE